MRLEEFEKRLTALQHDFSTDFAQEMAKLQAEYLSEQTVPDAETAIQLIAEAQKRGELPELDVPVDLDDWKNCRLLELNDDGRPDNGTWRCEVQGCTIDVTAEDGEVNLISV